MNGFKMLSLIVATGLLGSVYAQEAPVTGSKCSCSCKMCRQCQEKGKKGGADRKHDRRGPMEMKGPMMDRLAAEYPTEIAAIEKLKATDPAAAEKQMKDLMKKAMDSRRAEMKQIRDLAQAYKQTKEVSKLNELKTILGKQFEKMQANNKTSLANLEKKIAADKAAGKDVNMATRQLERLKKMSEETKDSFIEKQIKRLTSDRAPNRERKGKEDRKR